MHCTYGRKRGFLPSSYEFGKKPLYFCQNAHEVGKTNLSLFLSCSDNVSACADKAAYEHKKNDIFAKSAKPKLHCAGESEILEYEFCDIGLNYRKFNTMNTKTRNGKKKEYMAACPVLQVGGLS
ncbi:MAG: hypothetical protein J6O61_19215 [Butyrivibrio sp.]|uniref:hypothetical protein n=1 Tax=Butyrivibrio sp. TaxID=28121 RepID=UPI001B0EDBC4|nr:hypothetical protein [Butyrivibrio sp.]MBO6242934.1 hypothetical protein [Butyrivibrio sp.]